MGPHEQLVRETFAAIEGGDFEALEQVLTPAARWRAVEDGPWNCESRTQIVEVMRESRERGALDGSVEAVEDLGPKAIVAFRPAHPGGEQWPLDGGIRYLVLTFAGERIAELKGCTDRAAALAYAGG